MHLELFAVNVPVRPFALLFIGVFWTTAGSAAQADDAPKDPRADESSLRKNRPDTPTYYADVLPILQKRCQDCHHPGEVAPFSLLTYEQAKKRAHDLADVVEDHKMPPWPASTTTGGPFRDARILSKAEIETLTEWAEAGAPEGLASAGPPPRKFDDEWPLGKPDLVLKPDDAYTVGAEGRDEYRVFVISTGLKEGKWIRAVDYKPGNRRVVHHLLGAFDTRGAAKAKDLADPKPGYEVFGGFGVLPSGTLGGWAPGKTAHFEADSVGRYLPAGSDVLIQIHYHKSGKPESDQTAIGLYFARKPVDKLLRGAIVRPPTQSLFSRPQLIIPAGVANYETRGSFNLPYDAHLIGITPHMHLLGKDFLLTALRPDGSRLNLIKIDQWNFNWQLNYELEHPIALPKGTKIELLAHFDNSASNPNNPNSPPREVRWGEQTTDEMCIGFLQLTRDDEHLHNQAPARFLRPAAKLDRVN